MENISELFKKQDFNKKQWLIIGKGSSFSKIKKYDLNNFFTFGLNHVVKEVANLDITHLIDFNVFEVCENDIYNKAKYLCMPINPHFDNKPTDKTLKDLIKENKTLAKLAEEKRLFWYNHLEGDRLLNADNFERTFYENVKVKYFSAEVPFYILGMNNIKEVYSIGIDGGSNYSEAFKKSAILPNGKSSLLSNGRKSFDIQFDEIIKTINKYDLIYSPIDANYPVKVYVGSQEEQMLSVKVLEYSIKKRTNVDVEVFPLHKAGIKYPIPKDPKNCQRTPFSFQRFLIPQLNDFKGRAIYVDSDMQVLKDIRQLWNLPMAANDLLTVKNKEESDRIIQFSVMLLDCDKLQWSIDDIVKMLDGGELNYDSLMKEMKVAKNIGIKIDCGWNCLEWFEKENSSLIHYTDMPTQPWVSTKNPLGKIWVYDLINAVKEGFIPLSYIEDHIEKGWVRPSLLYQIKHNIIDSLDLPKEAMVMDQNFIAPYKKMKKKSKSNHTIEFTTQTDKIVITKKKKKNLYKRLRRVLFKGIYNIISNKKLINFLEKGIS